MKLKLLLLSALVCVCASCFSVVNAQSQPRLIAVFPMKNLTGEVQYDSLSWAYADSLVSQFNKSPDAGTRFKVVSSDDVRDQMLAQNVDVKSPSYETDVWKVAKSLGAQRIIWGTYFMKYEKANFEIKIIDVKTLLPDPVNIVNKLRPLYTEAVATAPIAAAKLLPGL